MKAGMFARCISLWDCSSYGNVLEKKLEAEEYIKKLRSRSSNVDLCCSKVLLAGQVVDFFAALHCMDDFTMVCRSGLDYTIIRPVRG